MSYLPTVTVVVCTHNRPELLRNCLASLTRQSYAPFDILVVESGPAYSAREISRAHGASYVHEPVAGISRARNTGVQASRGEIVAFIDDDAIAESCWLESLVPAFHDPAIGAAAGGTRYMKSYGEDRRMSDEIAVEPVRPDRVFGSNEKNWVASACFGGIGDGMNMAFRRSLLTHRVRFDERLGRGCAIDGGDEHVAFLQVLAMGLRIAYVRVATVLHPAPADANALAIRRVELMRNSIAYIVFLWFEYPAYRLDIFLFVWSAIRKRFNSLCAGTSASGRMSFWRALRAVSLGPLVYFKASQSWNKRVSDERISPDARGIQSERRGPAMRSTSESGLQTRV